MTCWGLGYCTRVKEIAIHGDYANGVCKMLNTAPPGVFDYLAGFKIVSTGEIPQGMVMVDVPANFNAAFTNL